MKTKLMILAFLAVNVGVLDIARRSPRYAMPSDLRDAVADIPVSGQNAEVWPKADVAPVFEEEFLPAQEVRTFLSDGYKTEKEAFAAMGTTLSDMRELEVQLVDASKSGVYRYTFNENGEAKLLYGFWIDYKGEEFNK